MAKEQYLDVAGLTLYEASVKTRLKPLENITSLESNLDNKVDKVEGSSLITAAQLQQIETNKTNIETIQKQLEGIETTLTGLNTRLGKVV